ncbi:MAG: AraC family transcriptional regulator [Thermoanaerobaculia bacterium]
MARGVERVSPALMEGWPLQVLEKVEVAGIRLWEIDLAPDFFAPPHEHELPFFCVLVAGELESRYGRKRIRYHRFGSVFHPAGTVHSDTDTPSGARIMTAEISSTWSMRLEGLSSLPSQPTPVPDLDGNGLARRLLDELHRLEPCSELVVEGLALEMLAATLRAPVGERETPAWMGRALARLHDGLVEPLTLKQLSHDLGIHPARLSAVFRRHTGRTVGEYRRELQVQFVRRRLSDRRHAGEPLSEIALAAGFADQAHCTRVFKALTGWTPARYRGTSLRTGESVPLHGSDPVLSRSAGSATGHGIATTA